jgi:hypothetical protein
VLEPVDYQAVLADLKGRRARLDQLIAGIEADVMGQAAEGTPVPGAGPGVGTGVVAIHPDTFFGLGIAEAAKKYLKMARRAQHTTAIADALANGGLKRPQENNVFSILARAAKGREVVKVGKGLWGLAEFYPKSPREPTESPRKSTPRPQRRTDKAKKPKAKREPSEKVTAAERTPAPPAQSNGAGHGGTSQIMLDVLRSAGKPLHTRDVTEQVHARGGTATAATVAGMLGRWAKQGKVKRTAPNTFAV